MKFRLLLSFLLLAQYMLTAQTGNCIGDTTTQPRGIFISTGDNNWTGASLPIDSRAAIDAGMDLFKDLGYGRVYWRGLQAGAWIKSNIPRPESVKYYELWKRLYALDAQALDRYASDAAHLRGMQFWGVGNFGDWEAQADAPATDDYPFTAESRLRIDSPQWVPHDKHGIMRQGGAIEYAYPAARKAVRNLYMEVMNEHQYDAAVFITYAENHSVRFQDEFGYNAPIKNEFQTSYGLNIQTQKWTRAASRSDWVQLRGKYFTAMLREMKDTLRKTGRKMGMMMDPHEPYYTQPWNVQEIVQTAGPVYQDLETWVRDSIVDLFSVYGFASAAIQQRVLDKMLWTTKGTKSRVAAFTSSALVNWTPYLNKGVAVIHNFNEDEMFLQRSTVATQPVSSLTSPNKLFRMKILSQLIYDTTLIKTVPVSSIAPLASDSNLLIRRMALKALGLRKDTSALSVIENGLNDPENAVRSIAAFALRYFRGPLSFPKMLGVVETNGNHSFNEIVITTIITHFTAAANVGAVRDSIKAQLTRAFQNSLSRDVRYVCLRILYGFGTKPTDVPIFSKALTDTSMAIRYFAAYGLATIYNNANAIDTLLLATTSNDPVVANRAASSLGWAIERTAKKLTGAPDSIMVASKRTLIKTALQNLFALQGDNNTRSDSAWGYRPVGMALLKLGAEGETILRAFMNQTTDWKLADHAWKVLYAPHKINAFTEITEAESEAAFQQRPVWLNP